MKQRDCFWDKMVRTKILFNLKGMKGDKITRMIVLLGLLTGCNQPDTLWEKRFRRVYSDQSGIHFSNNLTETESFNYFTYPYLYMGGGVAIGDFNNDGLQDIYFTGNMVENKLYLNKGNLKFEDITTQSGTFGDDRWYTGVTLVDINADGYLDLYLNVAGLKGDKKNQLWVNNGDLTFSERAEEYNIADEGQSIQSAFFDYDRDGDLDLYVANYPITSFSTPNQAYLMMIRKKDPGRSDKLYRNDGATFTDVTEEAGLLNFGLSIGITVADFNNDHWEDIYISNDFSTPDHFYFNNGDGTFTDHLKATTKQTAFYGMGTDAADFNNDGFPDLMQVDMAAQNNRRSKANMASMNPNLFWSTVNSGFHYQYMYNALQMNRGLDQNNLPIYSNVAWISGVSSTDWSWAPLFADLDNDVWKDLFVSNGTRKEINNRDFFKTLGQKLTKMDSTERFEASKNLPSEPIDNYVFRNMGGFTFEQVNDEWGLRFEGFSNGAAYGDLDNDGDLDLALNNIDSVAVIHQNLTCDHFNANFLRIKLEGPAKNPLGIGAKIRLVSGGTEQFQHLSLSRGFQSAVEPFVHFGIGKITKVDSVIVSWPDGKVSYAFDVKANQTIEVRLAQATAPELPAPAEPTLFIASQESLDSTFRHSENRFDDFDYQVLLPHKMSNFGPALAVADVNGDGRTDFYVGNGAGYAGRLYLQNSSGKFILSDGEIWRADARYEDVSTTFFDADNDGDQDLYVVSGGNQFVQGSTGLQDRLYLNANGKFTRAWQALPEVMGSGSCAIPLDIDKDGDLDLFVGGRHYPRNYPNPGRSHLLINHLNEGKLTFTDEAENRAPGLGRVGMVTDALWTDFDGDNLDDLIVVGEWMPVTLFKNTGGQLINRTADLKWDNSAGWWFSIEAADFDGDGDEDIIVGNLGLNYKYQASPQETFDIYASDFDQNNSSDIVLGYYNEGVQFPVRGRQCSSEQIPAIEVVFKDYNSFANATLRDIYGRDLDAALHYSVESFASVYLENQENGVYRKVNLPMEAQVSPINDMVIHDFNADGHPDVLIAGNIHASEVETPRCDAGIGLVMLGDGKGGFAPMDYPKSGLLIDHDTKALQLIKDDDHTYILAANNQGPLQIFKVNHSQTSK